MQFDLMLDNENSMIFKTEQSNYNSWKRIVKLINNGSNIRLKAIAYGYRIYTSNLKIYWKDQNLYTLEIYLDLLSKKDIDHNSVIDNTGEIINIHNFINQLMVIHGKYEIIDLKDIDEKWSGLYLSVGKDNRAIITRDRLRCKMNVKL